MSCINLNAIEFNRAETLLAKHGSIAIHAFRYKSGVAALRVTNTVGELIFLPFHGQQIWDVTFYGRRLTMRSMFDEPTGSTEYLSNYGAFLLHCGATAMGNPSSQDNHPVHGELPNAIYQNAEIVLSEDDSGKFVELTGTYKHTVAFSYNYEARPRVKFAENSGLLEMNLEIANLKNSTMDLMYLAHVNFKPVDDAVLIDTASDDPSKVRVRDMFPEFFKPTAAYLAHIAALQKQPFLHRKLKAGQAIDPELVIGLTFKTDEQGLAHSMQLLPGGSADVISHRPSELPHGVRWITRTADQDALGLFLPGTAEANGYIAEKAKGNVMEIAPKASFTCSLIFGALDKPATAQFKNKITRLND